MMLIISDGSGSLVRAGVWLAGRQKEFIVQPPFVKMDDRPLS